MRPRAEPSTIPAAARPYQGRRAGVVTRMTANAIDLVVVLVIVCGVYAAVAGFLFLLDPSSFHFPSKFGWSIPVIGFGVAVPYLTLCWRMVGRTYGDSVMGLRVLNFQGERMRFLGALLRAAFCVVFPIGVLWVAVSPANRSVQDVLLRTSVVYDWLPSTEHDVAAGRPGGAAVRPGSGPSAARTPPRR